jgi:hypothetical protein
VTPVGIFVPCMFVTFSAARLGWLVDGSRLELDAATLPRALPQCTSTPPENDCGAAGLSRRRRFHVSYVREVLVDDSLIPGVGFFTNLERCGKFLFLHKFPGPSDP